MLYFLREYCPQWADELKFGSQGISLHGEPFAKVQWDEFDVPTFLFQSSRDRMRDDIDVESLEREQRSKKPMLLRQERERILWNFEDECPAAIWMLRSKGRLHFSRNQHGIDDVWVLRSTKGGLSTEIRCLLSAKLLECDEKFLKFEPGEHGHMIFDMTFRLSPEGFGLVGWLDDVDHAQ